MFWGDISSVSVEWLFKWEWICEHESLCERELNMGPALWEYRVHCEHMPHWSYNHSSLWLYTSTLYAASSMQLQVLWIGLIINAIANHKCKWLKRWLTMDHMACVFKELHFLNCLTHSHIVVTVMISDACTCTHKIHTLPTYTLWHHLYCIIWYCNRKCMYVP